MRSAFELGIGNGAGPAWDCARGLRVTGGKRQACREARVPCLAYSHCGEVMWLRLELVRPGRGVAYPDPMALGLRKTTHEFLEAACSAWAAARKLAGRSHSADDIDLRWAIECGWPELQGGSHGAAVAVTALALLRGVHPSEDVAVSATVTTEGNLGPVAGMAGKVAAAFRAVNIRRLIVHPDNLEIARVEATTAGREPNKALTPAETLEAASEAASGLVECLRRYLERLSAPPERPAIPAVMLLDTPSPTATIGPYAESPTQARRASRLRRVVGWVRARLPFAGVVVKATPLPLSTRMDVSTRVDDSEVGERVTWDCWRQSAAGRRREVVVVGPAGQGKSVLLKATARTLADAALKRLEAGDRPGGSRTAPTDRVARAFPPHRTS